MGNRDLLLILNIVDYLLETTESAETKDDLRNVVIQGLGVDTINPETASSATENGTQDTMQANDFSGPQAVADNSSGDDPEQAWIGLPTLFLSDGYSPVITWPSFNDQYLPLSPIRAPPAA